MNSEVTAKKPQESRPPSMPDIAPCQILLIEDDADDRLLARRQLQSCKFVKDIATFRNGEELIDYMKSQGFMDRSVMLYTPILLLVDLEMPRKDGIEIIKELKSDPFLKSIPLVVLTGIESGPKINQARELGANGILKKPLDKHMLDRYFQEAWQWPPKELWL